MTKFNKELFSWDGMYLMYEGAHANSKTFEEISPECHPSRVGMIYPTFIARFKYGYKPWKAVINFLSKNVHVEEYLALEEATSPYQALRALGYKGKL